MIGRYFKHLWLWGAILGFLVPIEVYVVLLILNLNPALVDNLFAEYISIAAALLQLPVRLICSLVNLPIDKGTTAFIFTELTFEGYALVIIFWTLVGTFIGIVYEKYLFAE